ncbi:Unknown protein [Striga hermonthica]|uniref:Uncharacterized protein n=1 Tax=Striga hermonthica TaxID=68872 RepID=A0A9N7NM55_STRHE|nr:Unknown protein [Striga hermonthica]
MDLGSECSAHESVTDNEDILNGPTKSENVIEKTEVRKNGSCVENCDDCDLFCKVKLNQAGVTEHIDPTRKGRGLKKWRRIERDPKKGGGSNLIIQESSNSEVSSNKRAQDAQPNQRSRSSGSSTNAVVRTFDNDPQFSAWADSDSSENRSSNRVKIEKENFHSSLESDSRSFNLLFVQGTRSVNNRIRYGNGDDMAGGDEPGGAGCEACVADSSSEVKEEKSENHGLLSNQDPLHESVFELESAKEALEKELLKLKEIGKDYAAHESGSDSGTEVIDNKRNTISKQFPCEGHHSFSQSVKSEVLETTSRDVEAEVDYIFKKKFEAEVEHMAISRTVQELRVTALHEIPILEEQKALVSEQTQILDELEAAENKAALLEREAVKLVNICQDVARADEVMKLQKGVCKYSLYFLVQLVLLLVTLGAFLFWLSPRYVEVVPT